MAILLALLACALPARTLSLLRGENPELTPTATIPGSQSTLPAYPPAASATLAPQASPTPDSPALTSPTSPAITVPATFTQTSSAPSPGGGSDSYPTPPQSDQGSGAYPTPGNAIFVTATPTSNLAYPGQGTPGFVPPTAVLQSPTPGFSLTPSFPTAIPATEMALTSAVPPPAWINSQLRASDPSKVKLSSGKVQLLFFFAFWDGPSLAMAPLVHAIEQQYQDRVGFVYLDIDNPATGYLKDELGYIFQPEFYLVDAQGEVIEQWSGYVRSEELVSAIDAALQ